MKKFDEPEEAFPYDAPSKEIKKKYKHLFELNSKISVPVIKLIFDKVVAFLILLMCLPIVSALMFSNFIEGLLINENKGNLLFFYNGVSHGKIFRKWKFRIIKEKYIDQNLKAKGDWHAFKNEWMPKARTHTGSFIKKFYLDEIPQFFCVLKGEMSIVGPRPLAIHHYKRDLAQGNITRKLIRGGLLGYGHVRKGTSEFGKPIYEYEYAHYCLTYTSYQILLLDLKIICKGILLIFKGGGH